MNQRKGKMTTAAVKESQGVEAMLTWEVVPLVANVFSTVGIVFANKYVMGVYPFAMTVTIVHQCVAGLIIMTRACSIRPEKPLPFFIDAWIAVITVGSIYFCNQSLRINSVTLYQVSKLLNIPTMCFFQFLQSGKKYSLEVYMSLVALTVGVGISTIAEFEVSTSTIGLAMAAAGIIVTVVDQMEVGRLKGKHEISAVDFLHSNVLHRIAFGATIIGSTESQAVTEASDVPVYAWFALLVSCFLATSINLTQVMIIGKFGPLTMTVTSHVKTLAILVLSMFWNPPGLDMLLIKKIVGIIIAMLAAIKYGQLTAFPDSSMCNGSFHFLEGKPKMIAVAVVTSSCVCLATMNSLRYS